MLDVTRPEVTGASLDETLWDHETGETWRQALDRFATIGHGPLLSARDVETIHADEGETEVYSFGYGDDPEGFDGVESSEVVESIREDGADTTDIIWGPFIRVYAKEA